MKSSYKIVIVLALVLVLGIVVYLFWQKFTKIPEVQNNQVLENASLPVSKKGSDIQRDEQNQKQLPEGGEVESLIVEKISELPVFDFWITEDTKEIFYLTPEGRVYGAKTGSDTEVSRETLEALNSIEISPKKLKLLAAFGDPHLPQWGIFDTIDKTWRPLPKNILNATWGVNDDELIAIALSESGEQNVERANLKKNPLSFQTLLRDFRIKDVKLLLRDQNTLLLIEKPSYAYKGRVWNVDLKKGTIRVFLGPEAGLMAQWNEAKTAYTYYSSEGSRFYTFNEILKRGIPSFFSTLPLKCAVFTSSTYCFVPQNISSFVKLPDDYLQRKFYSQDSLFRVDHDTLETEEVFSYGGGSQIFDGINPRHLDGYIYFVNRYDNLMYRIKL